jgi:hypothetical protein
MDFLTDCGKRSEFEFGWLRGRSNLQRDALMMFPAARAQLVNA